MKIIWMKREDVDIILITAEPIKPQYDTFWKRREKREPGGGSRSIRSSICGFGR